MKLDMNKLAGSDRIKAAKDVLPAMAKPQAKEEAKETAPPAKKAEKVPVKKAEAKKEAPKEEKAPKEVTEAAVAKKAAEKSVPAEDKAAAAPVLKKKRGRPAIHPAKLDETGQKLINTNVPLDEELQLFLEYACEMNGGIAKASFIRKLVHSCYEKNFEGFHAWKRQRNKGLVVI